MTFNKAAFFDVCRKGVMGPTLETEEVFGAETILEAMHGSPVSHCAYALATAWHETAHTLHPIREYGGNWRMFRLYDIQGQRPSKARELGNIYPGDGVKFCGRGFVQLTGRANYAKAAKETGYPLEGNPDLAMRPDIAATIMRKGMEEGWFTSKAFDHFLPPHGAAEHKAFFAARRIINGSDRASLIADYAVAFQKALLAGGWA